MRTAAALIMTAYSFNLGWLCPAVNSRSPSTNVPDADDPGRRICFAARHEVSGLEVPGLESDFFAVDDVLHGTVRTAWKKYLADFAPRLFR